MRILAIETATADCSVALGIGSEVLQQSAMAGGPKPSEQVPGLIGRLLAEAGIRPADLDAIAFDIGPGAFTGIRIGCGLAQGMALGADLPLVGLCSLRVLAMQGPEGRLLATLDARMGEIYWALCERSSVAGRPAADLLDDPRVEAPALFSCPTGLDFALGDGLSVSLFAPGSQPAQVPSNGATDCSVGDVIPSAVRLFDARARPRASDMLPLARTDLEAGLGIGPEAASPLYVRDKVALTAAEQIARRAAR